MSDIRRARGRHSGMAMELGIRTSRAKPVASLALHAHASYWSKGGARVSASGCLFRDPESKTPQTGEGPTAGPSPARSAIDGGREYGLEQLRQIGGIEACRGGPRRHRLADARGLVCHARNRDKVGLDRRV